MNKVALVSYAGCPELTDDDRLLLPALRHLGVQAKCAVWDAPVDWTEFDQVILRSCWDYHLRTNEFIDGQYSHSVIKRPTSGDFRVQWQFGGDAVLAEAAKGTIEDVSKLLDGLAETPLYARVDGIECETGFVLMEVELIEPVLFLGI